MSPDAQPDEELWRELAATSGCSLQEVRNMQSQERRDMLKVCLPNLLVEEREIKRSDKDNGSYQGAVKRFRAGCVEVEESTRVATQRLGEGATGHNTSEETNVMESQVEHREESKLWHLMDLLGVDKHLLAVHREPGREAEDERQVPVFRSRKEKTTRPSTSPLNHDGFRARLGDIKSRGLFHSGKACPALWQGLAAGKERCSAVQPTFARTQEEQDMELAKKLEEREEVRRVRPATQLQPLKDWGSGKILGTMASSGSGGITTSSFYGLTSSCKPWSIQSKTSDMGVCDIKFMEDSEVDEIQDIRKKGKSKRGLKKLGPIKKQFMDD